MSVLAMIIYTLVSIPVWPLCVAAVLHVMLMNIKARKEERRMAKLHGQAY